MLIRHITLALGVLFFALAPAAFSQNCNEPNTFHKEFEDDVPGGHFAMGEDDEVSAQFRTKASGVVADFRVISPHRTKQFGSGVAFWVCSGNGDTALRVVFGDKEGTDGFSFRVIRFIGLNAVTKKN